MEKSLIILRGLPGSGKSTFAKLISEFVCTADDFLINGNGEYEWSRERAENAHNECKMKCENLMMNKVQKIVVANTSTTYREMEFYIQLAEKYGYKVFSIIVENRHGGISEHNVPEDTMDRMRKRFDIKL